MGLNEKDKVSGGISIFEISLELFIVLVVILGIAIVGSIVVFAIKKPKPTPPEEAFEEALQELELTGIKGIGSKRAARAQQPPSRICHRKLESLKKLFQDGLNKQGK